MTEIRELREEIAGLIDPLLELGGGTAREAYEAADRILALPQIADALKEPCNICNSTGKWFGNSSNDAPARWQYGCHWCGRQATPMSPDPPISTNTRATD